MHIYSIIGYLIINGNYSINAPNCNLGNNAWFSKPTWYKKKYGHVFCPFFWLHILLFTKSRNMFKKIMHKTRVWNKKVSKEISKIPWQSHNKCYILHKQKRIIKSGVEMHNLTISMMKPCIRTQYSRIVLLIYNKNDL